MDGKGLTASFGRRGRAITERGLQELHGARVFDKVGFLSARIDQLTYRMRFDLAGKTGTVIANISIVDADLLPGLVTKIQQVYLAGYGMGVMMALFARGERAGDVTIPAATFEENGIKVRSRALAGMIEYQRLFHYSELAERVKGL